MEMDNTVDAELALECDVCGMRDFYQEGGYFYCNLCNTQSQQSRLFVEDDEPDGGGASQQLRSRLAVLEDEEAIAASIVGGRKKLSSWEVFNLVLRSLTEKLISLGFPPLLRDEVLGLYARYLTKRKAIFVSEKSDKPSAITHLEPKTNIYAFYDRKRNPNEYVTTEKLEKKKKKAEKGADEEDVFSSAGRRRKRTAARRKAFEQEYLDYQSDHDRPPKSPYGKKVEEERDIALRCKEGKTVVFTDAYSQVRRELSQQTNINRVKPYEHPSGLSNDMKKCLEVESFTMKSVLILLYIALRKIGCRVLLSDVLRMYHEGTLRIDSIASILPAEEVNQLDLSCNKFLRSGVVGTLFKLRYFPRSFEGLLNYLEISHFPHPALKDFIPKFMDDLKLPQEYECFLSQLISLIPVEELVEELSTRYHRTFFHLFPEFLIYALITVQLKMLFGLDGVTEKFQSHFARRVNRVIKKATQSIDDTHKSKLEKSQLFVVEDWLAHLRYRRSVIHKELYFGSAAPNLKTVNQVVSKISHVPRASTSTVQACESIKSIFQDAVVDLTHGQGIPTLPTYLTPNLPNQDIIQTYVNCYPNIAHLSDCRKLSADFSKCSIDFVYHPKNYVKILKKAGYHVKLVDGDARNSSEDLQDLKDFQLKSKSLRLYQPYKLYDELVGPEEEQSDSIKFLLSLYCNTFPGCNQEEVKDKFRSLIHAVGDILNRKAAKDAIPLVIP